MYRISINVPKEMLDLAQNAESENKPYDICLYCPFIQKTCDGPNILSMEYPRWVEWANARAQQLRLTRARISELSDVPKGTVDNAMAGRSQDIRTDTMRRITKILIGGCWGQYPCHFAALLMSGTLPDDTGEADALQSRLSAAERDVILMEERLSAVKEDNQKKIDFLKDQISIKDRHINALGIGLGILILFILYLFADGMNGSWGFFQYPVV